jgi:hypothetical protein
MPKPHGRPADRKPKTTNANKTTPQGTQPTQLAAPTSQPQTRGAPRSGGKFFDSLGKIVGWLRSAMPAFVTWAATVLTIFAGAVVFLPRITVDPSGPYDPAYPSPITFTIANANIVPLRDVVAAIGLCEVTLPERLPGGGRLILKGTGPCSTGATITRLTNPGWRIKWLDADERWQIALEETINGGSAAQVENADITISVEYTPWRFPWFWRSEKQLRFVTRKRSDGKIYWVPTPLMP